MLRRTWKPLAASAVVVGASAYAYNKYTATRPTVVEAFDLAVREGSGMVTRSIPLIPREAVSPRINEHATLESKPTPEGLTWKHTTAKLASNNPLEDANAQLIVEKQASALSPAGHLLFLTVMDGHGGKDTSQLLSKVLIPAVALELATLVHSPESKSSWLDSIKSLFFSSSSAKVEPRIPLDADPSAVSSAIQRAFVNLDSEIINAPLRILAANLDKTVLEKKIIPDLSQHPMSIPSMQPAISGSCAIMALLDTARRDLYVACTGDCRAVAGIWEESEDGTGHWRVETLSEDQTGRNPNELKRIQSEHPPDEADDVIRRGRVLGGLEPSRAFGDGRYKWSRQAQEVLNKAFLEGNGRSLRIPGPAFKTPPYVTALPVVTHRKVSIPSPAAIIDTPSNPAPAQKSTLRFIVLATDGLWDQLSSEQVVSLVAGHLSGLKGNIPRSSLPSLVPTISGSPTIEGKDKDGKKSNGDGPWAFVDENVSAHLIRNAFGGGDEQRLRQFLSIPSGLSRRYRDDVTVTVLWHEPSSSPEVPVKAKL